MYQRYNVKVLQSGITGDLAVRPHIVNVLNHPNNMASNPNAECALISLRYALPIS